MTKGKKLALVVHGIGEQKPGETIEALVGGLIGGTTHPITTDVRLMRETDVDHQIDSPEKPMRDMKQYPCHVHRIEGATKDYVFAEAFWGDISRGANGTVRGVIDLFELVMGLGHVVRANAAEIYESPRAIPRRLANLFVYLLHGPLPALNFVFAIGVVLLFALQYMATLWDFFVDPSHITVLLIAAILILFYRFSEDRHRSHLYQIFRNWLKYMAAFLVITFGFTVAALMWFPVFFEGLADTVTASLLAKEKPISENLDVWYSAVFVNLIGLMGGVCLTFVCVCGAIEYIRRKLEERVLRRAKNRGEEVFDNSEKALYPQASALMITVWMLMVAVLWVVGTKVIIGVITSNDLQGINTPLLETYLSLAMDIGVWSMAAMVVVTISAIMVHRHRKKWVRTENKQPGQAEPVARLIVNRVILLGLSLAMFVLAWGAAETGLKQFNWIWDTDPIVLQPNNALFYSAFLGFATFIAFIYSQLGDFISMGIGVAKDIVVYFVRRPADLEEVTEKTNEYPLRRRIQNRFVDTLIRLIEIEKPTEILIISHSQGTVIALEALRGGQFNKILAERGMAEISPELVTMGSPTDHLYGFYFTKTFSVTDATAGRNVRDGISKWTNIYRSDDFVGTYVDGPSPDFPHNEKVMPQGHTNYWTDQLVLEKLLIHALPEFSETKEIKGQSQANRIVENLS